MAGATYVLASSFALLVSVVGYSFCDSSDSSRSGSNDSCKDETGLNLIQRGAQFKLYQKSINNSSLHSVRPTRSHPTATAPLALTLSIATSCPRSLLTPSAHFSLEASIRFGVVSSALRRCVEHNVSKGQIRHALASPDVIAHDISAFQHQEPLNISTAASFWRSGSCQKVETCLVDEADAWNRGFFHWLSMSWMDHLIGCYGKHSDNILIDSCEDSLLSDCEELGVHTRVTEAWDAEMKEKGVSAASIGGMIFRIVGMRMCCCFAVCAWLVAFIEYVGMVVALDVLLSSLSDLLRVQETVPFFTHSLTPVAIVIGSLFLLPVTHRCCNVLLIMMDGYFSRILSIGIGCLIYEKSLRLPIGSAYNAVHRGEENRKPSIAQLLSMDIANEGACIFRTFAVLSATPFAVIILLVYLVLQMRLAGLTSMLILIPCLLGMVASTRTAMRSRGRYQNSQDSRMQALLELLRSFSFMKPLEQEDAMRKINEVRCQELEASQIHMVSSSVSSANVHISIWCIAVGSLFMHLLLYGTVKAQHMWIIFQIIASLQACASFISVGSSKLLHVPNSFARIANYLKQSERPSDVLRTHHDGGSDLQICGSFTFEECSEPVLSNIDVSFSKGELVFIVGAAGSGKSALLQVALGELYPVGLAHVVAPAGVGYISQSPWIFDGTLQENVLMGQGLDQLRFQQAMEAAGITISSKGSTRDQILIGSSHHEVSGVESLRIALARAAYAQSHQVVLVDASDQTSHDLLRGTIMGEHWNKSTRIMVMALDSELLQLADRIVVLDGGRIVLEGPPKGILSDPIFQRLATACNATAKRKSIEENNDPRLRQPSCELVFAQIPEISEHNDMSVDTTQTRCQILTICKWMKVGGPWRFFFAVVCMVSQSIVQFCGFLGLAFWANDVEVTASRGSGVYVFAILTLALCSGMLLCISAYLISRFGKHASEQIHARALANILRKRLTRLPIGVLANLFSRDLAKVDCLAANLCFKLMRVFYGMLLQQACVMSIVPFCVSVCASPVYFAVGYFGSCYRRAVSSLLYCASQNHSSLQDMLGYNLEAHLSIRSNAFRRFITGKHSRHLALATQANYLFTAACKAWLTLRVTFCSCALVSAFVLYAILIVDSIGVGTLGLVVSLLFAFLADFEMVADLVAQSAMTSGALQRVMSMCDQERETRKRFLPRGSKQQQQC